MSKDGKIIVYTQGVWDMFHLGHLNILKGAKALGDVLIVGVNTDELVKQYKGYYPLMCCEDRTSIVAACRYVDIVIPSETLEKDELLENLDVDILVHGNDKRILGEEYMKKHNKRVIYLCYTSNKSSTEIRKALKRFYKEQKGAPQL